VGRLLHQKRIRDAGVEQRVYPIHAEARALPFADEFFDAVVAIDSYPYFGTDDHYLNYLARFIKPGGAIGTAGAGLMRDIEESIPDTLAAWWEPNIYCLHSPSWWQSHLKKTGIVDVEAADSMPDGWQRSGFDGRQWLRRTILSKSEPSNLIQGAFWATSESLLVGGGMRGSMRLFSRYLQPTFRNRSTGRGSRESCAHWANIPCVIH